MRFFPFFWFEINIITILKTINDNQVNKRHHVQSRHYVPFGHRFVQIDDASRRAHQVQGCR